MILQASCLPCGRNLIFTGKSEHFKRWNTFLSKTCKNGFGTSYFGVQKGFKECTAIVKHTSCTAVTHNYCRKVAVVEAAATGTLFTFVGCEQPTTTLISDTVMLTLDWPGHKR